MAENEFSTDIKNFIDKAGDRADAFIRMFSQDLAEEIITKSPVDTGFFRNAWRTSIGNPDLSGPKRGDGSLVPLGDNVTAPLTGAKAGDIIYISNNTVYGPALEYGHSKAQAPNGMIRITLAKVDSIANKALSKVKKGSR